MADRQKDARAADTDCATGPAGHARQAGPSPAGRGSCFIMQSSWD